MRYLPKSIEQRGLHNYLNTTSDQHGGNNYDVFVTLVETANKHKLAAKFKVDYSTIQRWIKIYEKEQAKEAA